MKILTKIKEKYNAIKEKLTTFKHNLEDIISIIKQAYEDIRSL